ncbi:MAG: hypothetical protein Kow0047_04880 [Anaerolineae bacterium]
MTSSEERLRILKMVEEGKLSAEEGAKLLAALAESEGHRSTASGASSPSSARWFRVRVTDAATGKAKVSVNIPLGLVDFALKLGARFAPELQGVKINEISEAIRSGMVGKIVDVTDEEGGDHVEIFVE